MTETPRSPVQHNGIRHVDTRTASQTGMRRQNLAVVLGTVAAHAELSRADVAGHTGLTRAAVSSLVDELIAAELVREGPMTSSGRAGRPGRTLALNDSGPAGFGLEIGVGHLGACVVDLRGEVRVWRRVERANAHRDPANVLAALADLAAAARSEAELLGLRPQSPMLSVPGLPGPGMLTHAPNLGWHDVPIATLWPGPDTPTLENEANLGALAELWAAHAPTNFLHVSAEAGIGAALIIDGRLYRGSRGYAGELGHMPVHPNGPRCTCGSRGCLELYANQEAVLHAAGLPEPTATDPVTALTDHIRAEHPGALDAIERAGDALGIALAGAIGLFDPAAVILGGAYAELGPWLLPRIRSQLETRLTVRPFDPETVTASPLGRRGPILGAALHTIQRILRNPASLG
ncbi:ROK family transcriptional regulator [Nocardia macrotermitis]|uniref:N-acetylglucosamine repressor n=1 Tax=Nocardia macrotermitis TaxID=2585198 RepID=A0A7K0CVN1_9NOCA|nr:ROK family transcriptional regulator [Nocardia macrotermitis]MQY17443.1 N-acetylglucosamine repressor [Nocardia macrotermitis]